ncbi:MAG: Nicotinamide-nucleotide amidohydrolase PncC [Chlamydiae bacterium]|nr:Nicotinamide-nucleotide amidohydrolase PncC [Chlamydiota bacterium]
MKIELIVIGNEVLLGHTMNTNAAFIGKELHKKGYTISRQTTLPDEEGILLEGLREALRRSDLVISTGGLGPTVDDVTRNIAAELFDSDFHFDKNVAKDLENRFGKDLPTLQNQATVPTQAEVLINTIGTAPGMVLNNEMGTLLMLPGVPNEMHPMFLEQAIPYLLKHFPLKKQFFYKTINLFEIPEFSVDPFLRELKEKYPDVEFGIYPSLGVLSLQFSTYAEEAETAMRRIDLPRSEIEMKFASNCFESESGKLEETVQHIFVENQWTLSIAESCTGGSASSGLTQLSGASEYFLGSIVSYANSLKTDLLGVPESLIKEKGAVSEEVVSKMVEGVLEATGSDFGLAVSGIAGPTGGTARKPVGTVWCAVCRKGKKPHTWKLQARGTRQMIINRSVNSLLSNLLLYTKETSLL